MVQLNLQQYHLSSAWEFKRILIKSYI